MKSVVIFSFLMFALLCRKYEVYSMDWGGGINLGDFMVASAPYGGPLALTRDETKFTKTQQTGKPLIFIFSSSGKKISSFKVLLQASL